MNTNKQCSNCGRNLPLAVKNNTRHQGGRRGAESKTFGEEGNKGERIQMRNPLSNDIEQNSHIRKE